MQNARTVMLADLIGRVARSDRRAFETLYEATSAQVNALCLSILTDRRAAEELLEQVYIAAWQSANGFSESGLSPMAWLFAITRARAMARLDGRDPPAAPAVAAAAAAAAAAEPPPDPAAAVRYAYLCGLDEARLAARAGIPPEAARQLLRDGLARMAEEAGEASSDIHGFDAHAFDVRAAESALGVTGPAAGVEPVPAGAAADPGFARALRRWQERLAELAGDLTPVLAPARARQRVRESLGHGLAPLSVDPLERTPWWRSLPGVLVLVLLAAALGWALWPG